MTLPMKKCNVFLLLSFSFHLKPDGLALFLGGRFDVEVYEFLAIDDRDAEFLGLRRIEQHAFHYGVLPRANTGRQTASGSGGLISLAGLKSSKSSRAN